EGLRRGARKAPLCDWYDHPDLRREDRNRQGALGPADDPRDEALSLPRRRVVRNVGRAQSREVLRRGHRSLRLLEQRWWTGPRRERRRNVRPSGEPFGASRLSATPRLEEGPT